MSNMFTVVARLRAAKGKGDALEALLVEQTATVRRAEPGCLVYRAHRSTTDPELFLFYEAYVDEAAFDVHRTSAHMAAFRQRRDGQALADGPAQVEVFRAFTE